MIRFQYGTCWPPTSAFLAAIGSAANDTVTFDTHFDSLFAEVVGTVNLDGTSVTMYPAEFAAVYVFTEGGTNTVTVSGSGFVSGSTAVDFGSNLGTSVDVTGPT